MLHHQIELVFKNNIVQLSEKSFFRKKRKYKKISFFSLPLDFKVVTWNHLLSYIPNPNEEKNLIPIDTPFVYLSDNLIKNMGWFKYQMEEYI